MKTGEGLKFVQTCVSNVNWSRVGSDLSVKWKLVKIQFLRESVRQPSTLDNKDLIVIIDDDLSPHDLLRRLDEVVKV